MAHKLFFILAVAAFISQGYGAVVEDIRLEDETVNHISNPLTGRAISIPHLVLDSLQACSVTFPNGITYDIYPINRLPNSVSALNGVFPACGLGFSNPPASMSGTYELTAVTLHRDNRRTRQIKRFIINFTPSELWA